MSRPGHPVTRRYIEFDSNSRALMDAVTESVCILDHEGAILAANDVAADLFGFASKEDITGLTVWELLPEEARGPRQEQMDKAVDTGRPVRFEDVVEGRHFQHSIFPVFGYRGAVVRLAVFTSDVTNLIRSDEDLRREQQRHIFLMEALPGFAFILDQDHSIRYANRTFRRLFGRYKKRRGLELLYGRIPPAEAMRPAEVLETQRPLEFEWVLDDGAVYHVHCHPMAESDGSPQVVVLGIEVTERRQAEQALVRLYSELEERVRQRTRELQQANESLTREIEEHKRTEAKLQRARKKAEAATRAKSWFLANMSHEIRTPLNAVIGMTDLALRTADAGARTRYLEIVKDAGGSLLSVINDILDFSKIEARKLELEHIPFDLGEAMGAALGMHGFLAEQQGLDLVLDMAEDVPRHLSGDPGRLRQVVHNLLANAFKFTSRGGVRVLVRAAEPPDGSAQADGDHGRVRLLFSVTDTGIGIPPDKLQAVFQSFEQADGSVTRQYGGTGLGLAISRHLARLMGGSMTVESEVGRGSTFSFTADFGLSDEHSVRCEREAAKAACAPAIPPPLAVLVAEDSALNRELVDIFLTGLGHRVTLAENGAQALDILAKQGFDLVLMDVQMPRLDGLTATRRIRSGRREMAVPCDVPIIALTAHAMAEDRERVLAAGMNDCITKPIDLDRLLGAMARAVEGRARASLPPAASGPSASGPARAANPGPGESLPPSRDRAKAMKLLGDNQALMRRLEHVYLRDTPKDMDRLRVAVAEEQGEEAALVAHMVKGASQTIGADRAGELSRRMEFAAQAGRLDELPGLLEALEAEVRHVLEGLARQANQA